MNHAIAKKRSFKGRLSSLPYNWHVAPYIFLIPFILSFLIAGLNVVLGGYFTSVERAGFATMISLTRSLVALVISLVFLTAVFGGEAIWWAPVIAESCCVVLALGLYRWYRKREK